MRSVQEKLEKALAGGERTDYRLCAGRTDAGVHGTGQVVHFETRAQRKDAAWTLGVNANLPGDIAVRWVKHDRRIFTPGSAPRRAAIATSSIIIACVRRC